ncbi:hypothetical protein BROUX41_003372 [Berkeleyomyces rouxiae]|uniref:uncharacterized protein n=1 Tax=Berkeleyomyces rouxiae TaxID=2035830 RepID=UPI003B7BC43D
MPSSAAVRSMTSQFQMMTGDSERTATRFLKAANYNMNEAMKAYVAANSKYSVEVPLNQIFDSLRGKSDPKDSIGIESSMNYLTETLCVNLENAEMFVALEAVRAPSIGQITRQSFVDGWMAKNVPVDNKAHAACIRDCTAALSRDSAYFKTVYRYAFVVGKEPDQKSLSLENAAIYWTMLFTAPGWEWKTSRHNWLDLWLEYLKEHYSRPVNKDMWNQTLEFARRAVEDETLSFWSEDGAWPGVIDDFVAWFYEKFEDPRKKGDYEEDEGSD